MKRRTNLREHGIDFADLGDFFAGDVITEEDTRYEYPESRFQSIGMLGAVALFVVWTPADAVTIHLISARRATRYEAEKWFSTYSARH